MDHRRAPCRGAKAGRALPGGPPARAAARGCAALAALLPALLPVSAAAGSVRGPWLQNVTAQGISVMWEADRQESATPTVDYGTTTGYGSSVNAVHAAVNGSCHVYTATITGLSANTVHHYRVNSGSTATSDATFKTAIAKGAATGFRFYIVGDSQASAARGWSTSVWTSITESIRADMDEYPLHHQTFVLHTGDIADDSAYANWAEFVPPAQAMMVRLPVYPAHGNHIDDDTALSDAFIYGFFDTPYAESGSTDEKWYSFDYGRAHVASMALFDDAGYTSGAQYDWIGSDLAAAKADSEINWRFANMHLAPWSYGPHTQGEASDLETFIHPIFSAQSLTAAFGGHNHLYCRYAPVDGVTYITTGAANAPLYTGVYGDWAGATRAVLVQGADHYCIVDVEADAVTVRAIGADGVGIDCVTFGGTAADRPPFADAGADVSASAGTRVTLDASASADPEGAALAYEWTQVSGPALPLSGADTAAPYFSPAAAGVFLFRVRVNDGSRRSAPDFCAATITPSLSIEPGTLRTGEYFSFVVRLTQALDGGFDYYCVADTPFGPFTLHADGRVTRGIEALYRDVPGVGAPFARLVNCRAVIPAAMGEGEVTFYAVAVEAGEVPPVAALSDLTAGTPHLLLLGKSTVTVDPGTL